MRKPSWLEALHRSCPELHPVRCGGCGLWVIEDRDRVEWSKWDAGVVTGDDLSVAIILGRFLLRLTKVGALTRLTLVFGTRGLESGGEYLAGHRCGCAPISVRPFKPGSVKALPKPVLPECRAAPGYADPWAGIPVEEDTTEETEAMEEGVLF